MLDSEMIEDTAKIVNEAIMDRLQVYLIINNRAGGNAPLIAEKIVDRLHSEKQPRLFWSLLFVWLLADFSWNPPAQRKWKCWKKAVMISRDGKKRKRVRTALILNFGVVKNSRFQYHIANRPGFFPDADNGTPSKHGLYATRDLNEKGVRASLDLRVSTPWP
jgi:hypothetical protein